MSLFTIGFSLFAETSILAAEESEKAENTEKQPIKEPEPVEPAALRNDRALAEELDDGVAKWLKAGKNEFLGIYNADSSGSTLGSVLILPEVNTSPLTPGVLPKLVKELSSKGWHSLAITLPELNFSGPSPTFPTADDAAQPEKIKTEETKTEDTKTEPATEEPETAVAKTTITLPDAKKWFAEQETKNMEKLLKRLLAAEAELVVNGGKYVLIAQGTSAELVLELISSQVIKPSGFISLNIQHPESGRASTIAKNLAAIKLPILDIYNLSESSAAEKRKSSNKSVEYRQLYIVANDSQFRGSEQLLIKRVRGWLKNNYSN